MKNVPILIDNIFTDKVNERGGNQVVTVKHRVALGIL